MNVVKKIFTVLARIIAVLFAIIFVAGMVAAILVFNIERNMFDAQIYKDAFQSANLYEQLPTVIARQLTSAGAEDCGDNPALCAMGKFLTVKDWEALITIVFPADVSKRLVEESLDAIFAFVNNDSDQASISIVWLKEYIKANGIHAALQLVRTQPPCSAEQLINLASSTIAFNSEGNALLCNPGDEIIDSVVAPLAQSMIFEQADELPDEIPLIPAIQTPEGEPTPQDAIQLARFILRLMPLLPVAALLGIALFAIRSLRGLLLWWGIPLTIGSVLTLSIGLALSPIARWAMTTYAIQDIPSYYTAEFVQLMINLGMAALSVVGLAITIQSLIFGFVGTGMIVGAFFTKPAAQD
jgi:hypothetical protein